MKPESIFTYFNSKTENPHFAGVYDVLPQELNELLKNKANDLKLIDVRQYDEYVGELGHIPAAELIILDTLPEKIGTLPKDKTVIFICRSGARSARAAAFAQLNGFQSVFNLHGGMILWNDLDLPTKK